MKRTKKRFKELVTFQTHIATTYIQAPLPNFLHTLPILLTIPGQGSVLAGFAPLAPPEKPAND